LAVEVAETFAASGLVFWLKSADSPVAANTDPSFSPSFVCSGAWEVLETTFIFGFACVGAENSLSVFSPPAVC
jgi:hypothetical protein